MDKDGEATATNSEISSVIESDSDLESNMSHD